MSQKTPHRWKSPGPAGAARRFVAVDFDSRQVRLVQVERSRGGARIGRVVGHAAPDGLDLADAKAVGQLLRSALKEAKLAGWPVVMCVPRGLAVLKTLLFPPATREAELAGMVQYQVEKELPFRPEEAVVDFTAEDHFHAGPTPEEAGGTQVLVAAVRVPVVDYYRQIALAAGVKLLRLGLRPYANQRCFAAAMPGASADKCAVVHITADETEIDVVVGESLAFSRSSLGKVPDASKATPAQLAEAASGVATEVVRSLQSYQSVEGGGKVDRVYLAGGTGIENLVARELAERQGLRCLIFDPGEAMKLSGRRGAASEFISALGLAAGCGAVPLDFLHPKRPAPPKNVRRTRAILAAAAAVVLLVAGVTARGNYLGAKQALVNARQAEFRKLNARKKGLDANSARVSAIEAWEKKGQNWLDHFAVLSAEFPSAKDAYTGAISSNEDGSLKFTVHAVSEETITAITKRLDQAGYEVLAGRQRKTNNDPRYPHTAELKVRPRPDMMVDLESLAAVPRPEDDMGPGEVIPRVRPAQPAPNNPNPSGNPGGGGNVGGRGSFNPAGNPGGGGNVGGRGSFNPSGNQGGGGSRGARGYPYPGPGAVNVNPTAGPVPRDPNRRWGRRGGGQ